MPIILYFFPSKPAQTDSKITSILQRPTWATSDSRIMLRSKAQALSALGIFGNTHFLAIFESARAVLSSGFYCTRPLSSFRHSSSADASPSWYFWGLLLLSTQKYVRKQDHHQQELVSASLYSFPRMGSNYLLKTTHQVLLVQESDDQCPTNPRENKHFQLTSFSFLWSFDNFQCGWVLITKEI